LDFSGNESTLIVAQGEQGKLEPKSH